MRPYLWKYLQYYHYLFHFYWIFFCISISSSSHNLPSPVLLWLDRTLDIRHELASGWPQRRSRITNAPGSRIKTHLSFFYLYLPTFLIFPDGSSLFHFPLLVSFRGSQFSHILQLFSPLYLSQPVSGTVQRVVCCYVAPPPPQWVGDGQRNG